MSKPRRKAVNGKRPQVQHLRTQYDTPIKLLKDLDAGIVDPQDLTPTQRRCALLACANGRRTSIELAQAFKVSPAVIRKDMMLIRRQVGREVKEWTLDEVIGDLAIAAEKATAMAMKEEDAGLMWTIRKEFAKTLLDMGVVEKKQQGDQFRATIEVVSSRYDHATAAITQILDPLLTGEVIEDRTDSPRGLPGLPMATRSPVDLQGRGRGSLPITEWPELEPTGDA